MHAPRTALASFPRSGNTWVRYLIERLSGRASGSIYRDRVLPRGPEGIVVKTHALDAARYGRAILLVRDPFDAVLSFHRWTVTVAGRPIPWAAFAPHALQDWLAHTRHWLAASQPRLVLRYERLRRDPAEGCRQIASFLGLAVDEPGLRAALAAATPERMRELSPLGERFFGAARTGEGAAAFSPAEQRIFLAAAEPLLERLREDAPD